MENLLKISIITPNYNGGKYLERTIQSILNQNYPNLEYIVVDGGSTDSSLKIIDQYKTKISKFISEPDKGMYDALIKGLKMSTGDIIAYLNSDDVYVPGTFDAVSQIFYHNPKVQWLTGQPSFINEAGHLMIFNKIDYPRFSLYGFLAGDYKFIQQESTFWRRNLLSKVDFQKINQFKYAGDFALWMEFFEHDLLYVAPNIFGNFRIQRPGYQLSSKFMKEYILECEKILKDKKKQMNYKDVIKILLYKFDKKIIKSRFSATYKSLGFRQKYLKFPNELEFDIVSQTYKIRNFSSQTS